MARNLARSSNGTSSRSASASTRALKSRYDSSRFSNRASMLSGSGTGPRVVAALGGLLGLFVVRKAEIPVENQVLALGVAHDSFAVAAELRVVRREQFEPGHDPRPELVDHRAVTEVGVDLPV